MGSCLSVVVQIQMFKNVILPSESNSLELELELGSLELVALDCSRLVFSMDKDWFHIAITFRFPFCCFTCD